MFVFYQIFLYVATLKSLQSAKQGKTYINGFSIWCHEVEWSPWICCAFEMHNIFNHQIIVYSQYFLFVFKFSKSFCKVGSAPESVLEERKGKKIGLEYVGQVTNEMCGSSRKTSLASFPVWTGFVTSLSPHLLFLGLVVDKYYVNGLELQKGGKFQFRFSIS